MALEHRFILYLSDNFNTIKRFILKLQYIVNQI